MEKPKIELTDLDQPMADLSAEQATDVRGGLFTTGITTSELPAVQDSTASSGKVQTQDFHFTSTANKATP